MRQRVYVFRIYCTDNITLCQCISCVNEYFPEIAVIPFSKSSTMDFIHQAHFERSDSAVHI